MLRDIAILTGGEVITDELGLDLKEVELEQLGRARQVKVEKENTIIVDGAGDKALRAIDSEVETSPLVVREIKCVNSSIPLFFAFEDEVALLVCANAVEGEDAEPEYLTDPELIHDVFESRVDLVVDGGMGENEPSTVVDCSGGGFEVIRYGKGEIDI